VRHRLTRHRDEPLQRGPGGRGLPGRRGAQGARRARDAAVDRPCPTRARLRARALLAGRGAEHSVSLGRMDPMPSAAPPPRLVELAHAHGVATEYWDWQGNHVVVTAAT